MKKLFLFSHFKYTLIPLLIFLYLLLPIPSLSTPIVQEGFTSAEQDFIGDPPYYNHLVVVLNDAVLDFKAFSPELINNRTVVPLKILCKSINAKYVWNKISGTMTIYKDNKRVYYDFKNKSIFLSNGMKISDQPLMIKNNTAYGSISPLCTALGYDTYFLWKPNRMPITRIYQKSATQIENKRLYEVLNDEILKCEGEIQFKIIEQLNRFEVSFINQTIKLKPWEPIGSALKINIHSNLNQNFKVYWSQDSPNGTNNWEDQFYSPEQSCPFWYCWDIGEHQISAKIDNGHISKKITFMVNVIKPPEKTIYLTFDDGPNAYTLLILDLLDKYDFKATFFVLLKSNTLFHQNILTRMQNGGHKIALHGSAHFVNNVYASDHSVLMSMANANNYLEQMLAIKSYVCRSPYGSVPYMTRTQLYLLKQNQYKLWDWNIDSLDSHYINPLPKTISDAAIGGIKKHKTCVVLFHDKVSTVQALPTIFDYIKRNNFEVKIISEDLPARNFIEGSI